MAGKKILWLCSWYPGKTDPYNGDFIQRHARAAALYNDVTVIHVTGDLSVNAPAQEVSVNREGDLSEKIIYYKKTATYWGRFTGHYRLLRIFKKAVREYLEENGKPDLVHVHIPIWAGVTALWLKRSLKIPFVLTEHWGIYNDIEVNNYNNKPDRLRRYTKIIFEEAAKFTSVSRFLGEGVNSKVIKKEYLVIPNVVNIDFFLYKEKKRPVFRFIHVSNMVPLKNAEGILSAFALFLRQGYRAELVMVGDRDPAIREYSANLGLPGGSVSFRGEVPYEQVAREMQEADSFILFSNIENSPCVIGEALCCGLPVITTAVGGIPELVDENNSILVEPGNEEQLAACMQNMMSGYARFDRVKISTGAQKRFNPEQVGMKLDEVYNTVIGEI